MSAHKVQRYSPHTHTWQLVAIAMHHKEATDIMKAFRTKQPNNHYRIRKI